MTSEELKAGDKGAYKSESLTMEIWACPTSGLKGGAVLCYGLAPRCPLATWRTLS